MLEYTLMLHVSYCAQNCAGIISKGLKTLMSYT